jgi:putative transcriptional regulator
MSLRNRFLFAMLFVIIAAAVPGMGNIREPSSASALPIQSKSPKDLGVGKVLVASRGLGDPNFAGTVILLVHYDEDGVVGLVLNRRTTVPLSKVLALDAAKNRADPVYLGGPMEPAAVFALFQSPTKIEKAENLFGGVYLISDKDAFEQTISSRPDPGAFRVYLGYAGWTRDQLQAEVKLGAWFVFPADNTAVFNSDPDSLWKQMIQKTELLMASAEPQPPAPTRRASAPPEPVALTPSHINRRLSPRQEVT